MNTKRIHCISIAISALLLTQAAFADRAEEVVDASTMKQAWQTRIIPPMVDSYLQQVEAAVMKLFGPEATKTILIEERGKLDRLTSWEALGRTVAVAGYRQCDDETLEFVLKGARKEPIDPQSVTDALKAKLEQCKSSVQKHTTEELPKQWAKIKFDSEAYAKRFKLRAP